MASISRTSVAGTAIQFSKLFNGAFHKKETVRILDDTEINIKKESHKQKERSSVLKCYLVILHIDNNHQLYPHNYLKTNSFNTPVRNQNKYK